MSGFYFYNDSQERGTNGLLLACRDSACVWLAPYSMIFLGSTLRCLIHWCLMSILALSEWGFSDLTAIRTFRDKSCGVKRAHFTVSESSRSTQPIHVFTPWYDGMSPEAFRLGVLELFLVESGSYSAWAGFHNEGRVSLVLVFNLDTEQSAHMIHWKRADADIVWRVIRYRKASPDIIWLYLLNRSVRLQVTQISGHLIT